MQNSDKTMTKSKDSVFIVKCKKCGVEMEACDGFEPLLCANCVFGYKKCQREGCDKYSKNLFCSQDCKDQDDAESAQREAEWQSNEQNQVNSESETMKKTIKISGYSEGDRSVGIGQWEFSFDTGLIELEDTDRQFLMDYFIPTIWELHDNGTLHYGFSDEEKEYRFGYEQARKLQESKNGM